MTVRLVLRAKLGKPRQLIVDLEPGQLLAGLEMASRRYEFLWMLERADIEMHLSRPLVVVRVRHRRAARGAEIAPHTRRRLVGRWRSFEISELLDVDADKCRDGGRGMPAAALAVAIGDPLRLALELKLEGAAQAMALG